MFTFLPNTLELLLVAMLFTVAIGFFLGLATAQHWRGSGALRVVMISGASVPVFLACLLAMLVFTAILTVVSILLRDPIAQAVGVKKDAWAAAIGIPAACLWLELSILRGALQGAVEPLGAPVEHAQLQLGFPGLGPDDDQRRRQV